MSDALRSVFKDMPVLVTGHTGFKGSWLAIWLHELGAKVVGYSLDPPTTPSNFEVCCLGERITDVRGDVRDLAKLCETIEKYRPQVIFHLAAQAILLRSLEDPKETMDTNVGGTVNILEAVRKSDCVKAVVCITSDKCYENQGWFWGYRENDQLGGRDPYSASKGMAELAISAYRRSFFPNHRYAEHGVAIASTRAGNVIGGGDFGEYRLVPDCMRALMEGKPILVRNPDSVRPWQDVLEPLSGYLWLAAKLLENGADFAEAWNFGPMEPAGVTTREVAEKAIELWGSGSWVPADSGKSKIEVGLLRLNWDKAANRLAWRPVYTWEESLAETVKWFRLYHERKAGKEPLDMYGACVDHIVEYRKEASRLNLNWAN